MKRIFVAALTSSLLLMGCTPTVTLMSRDTGELGSGTVQNATFENSGTLEINFADETYTGTWIVVRDSGSINTGLLSTYGSNGSSAFGNLFSVTTADGGIGNAILRSNKGNSMRCEFRYSTSTLTAIGVCRKQDGEVFDLQAV